MKSKVTSMRNKALHILRDENYIHAKDLAEKLGMSRASVYVLIRGLRHGGIGVHPNPKGYILSEFASKNDDVHFMRRLNGRRSSDYMSLRAAESEMRKRWASIEDRRNLRLITAPIIIEPSSLVESNRILLEAKKSFEVPVLKTKNAMKL